MTSEILTVPEQIEAAVNQILRKMDAEPDYKAEVVANPLETFRAAGIPDSVIETILRADGVEETEVAGYLSGPGVPSLHPGGAPGPAGLIIGGICVGTCRNATIIIGCTNSFPQAGSL